jgi:hypothetical protein
MLVWSCPLGLMLPLTPEIIARPVFFDDKCRARDPVLLAKCKKSYRIIPPGYSLIGNHVQRIAVRESDSFPAEGIGRSNNDNSRRLNVQCNQTDPPFQARFYFLPVSN